MPFKKITKKRLLLGLMAGFITFVVLYILLPPIELTIEFYNTDDLEQAKNKLNLLVEWSETNATKELDFAKNLSKENYNQQRVTEEIIKNLKDIKTTIENVGILSSYIPPYKYNENGLQQFISKVIRINNDLNSQIILHLLYNERNITHQKSYFLFDKERFKALEDFLTFTSDRLREDFLNKDYEYIDWKKLLYNYYTTTNRFMSFLDFYIGDFNTNICSFNETKLQNLIQNVKIAEQSREKIISFFEKLYEKEEDEFEKDRLKKLLEITRRLNTFSNDNYIKLQTIQSKFKECKNERNKHTIQ